MDFKRKINLIKNLSSMLIETNENYEGRIISTIVTLQVNRPRKLQSTIE